MIKVILADHQALFRIGMVRVLAEVDDICIVGEPRSAEQLLDQLDESNADVLILSTAFLPAFKEIRRMLQRRQTALLVLADESDQAAYTFWLRARGLIYRSVDAPLFIDAMRRVARGELFIQPDSSDARKTGAEVMENEQDSTHL